jgi:hypothetical protein
MTSICGLSVNCDYNMHCLALLTAPSVILSVASYYFETINVDNATVARHSSSNIVVGLFAEKRQNATNFGRRLLSRRLPPPIAGAMQFVSFVVITAAFIYKFNISIVYGRVVLIDLLHHCIARIA